MRERGAPKPLPVKTWTEPIDADHVAIMAFCSAVRPPYVYGKGAFRIVTHAERRRLGVRALEEWALTAIAMACGHSAEFPATRYHHLGIHATLGPKGEWVLRS